MIAYTDDEVLVAALCNGEEAAFAWLVDTYSPRLRRLALTFVSSPAVADEVVQETWLAVIKGIERFERRSSVKTWIHQILMNIARTRSVREHRTIPFSSAALGDGHEPAFPAERFRPAGEAWSGWWVAPPRQWEPADRFDLSETMRHVREAISMLPPAQRTVMSLRDIDGWSSEEVCQDLGISAGNQRVLLHRARAKVRAALNPYFERAEP